MYMNRRLLKIVFTVTTLLSGFSLMAQDKSGSMMSDASLLRYTLAGIIVLFVFMIAVLAGAIKVAAKDFREKILNSRKKNLLMIGAVILLSQWPHTLWAQDAAAAPTNDWAHHIINNWDFYFLLLVVLILFVAVVVMVRVLFVLMGIKKESAEGAALRGQKVKTWFQRVNETVAIEDEASIDLNHDYDGIRELDNKVPSWWTWGFYLFILFSVVYLYRFMVSGSMPNQFQELAMQNEEADRMKEIYLKNSANNIDENNVVLLGPDGVAEGAKIYSKNCVACHGDKGQGGVGPNMTDDYWIHKGGIKDIFYSVKYGWQEKGMKSWKDDLSPQQIAQVSSFVKSLHGTNPPAPKAAQGDLYTEEAAATSTNPIPVDSVKKP